MRRWEYKAERDVMKLTIALLVLLLGGCAVNPTMTPEQIMATVKDKSSDAGCVKAVGPGFNVEGSWLKLDQGVVRNGNISVGLVNGTCVVSVSNAK